MRNHPFQFPAIPSMKKSVFALTLAVCGLLSTGLLSAQTTPDIGKTPTTLSKQPTPSVTRHVPVKSHAVGPARVSLALKWNEAQRSFIITLDNPSDVPLNVMGVQTSNGVYVADFPRSIPAQGKSDFRLLYFNGVGGGTGEVDLLRVLTDRGERVVQIDHDRDPSAQLDKTTLQWSQGATVAAKTVTLVVTPGTSLPLAVRAMGTGNQATLEPIGKNRYRISITPGATDKIMQFPVIITFDQAAPGETAVIACEVVPAGR